MGSWSDFTNQHIFKFKYDRTNISGEIIGPSAVAEVTQSYSSAFQNPAGEGLRLGDGYSNTYDINAKIGEVLYYNSSHTPEQETKAEGYGEKKKKKK